MDGFLEERVPESREPERERVDSRSREIRREYPEAEDPEAAAEQGLKESDARTNDDPARGSGAHDDRVERRKSEDTTPAPEDPDAGDRI